MPLRLIAGGLLMVALDLRVDGVDLVPDVIGLVLVAVGLRRLGAGDPVVVLAVRVSAVAAVLSLADLVRVPVVSVVYDVAVAIVPVLIANYLAIRAARAVDVPAERIWLRLRDVVLILGAATLGLGVLARSGPLAQLLFVALLASVVAIVVFMVTLLQHARRPWAVPSGA